MNGITSESAEGAHESPAPSTRVPSDGTVLSEPEDLVDRLAAHRTLASAPRAELAWLAAHGELRAYAAGEIVVRKDGAVDEMIVLLAGRVAAYVDRGSGVRHVLETLSGDVTGVLPYSRVVTSIGEVRIEESAEGLFVHRSVLPEMIRACPITTEMLVHVMIERSRHLTSTRLQDDRMISLGRLAAGMAHELNNPASAATRGAKLLAAAMSEAASAAHDVGAAPLSDRQRATVLAFRDHALATATPGDSPAVERSDREERMMHWLEQRHMDGGAAAALVDSDITPEMLDALAESLDGGALGAALRWIAAECAGRSLATDVARATARIYDLVSAVQRFTFMDRPAALEATDVGHGLADTMLTLGAKARAKRASVGLDVSPSLPSVRAVPGDLNQVWANLIENAIDAVGQDGTVSVTAARDGDELVVRVIDDGPGIPREILGRIFEPFFTTKPVGKGTGLGLDVARRLVREHDGTIAVDSRPGRTEFRVVIPLVRH
jgi:signal transduction histidine kinase